MPYPVASARGTSFPQLADAFVGAYDELSNIRLALGVRRLLSAYTGYCLRVREDAGDTEQDFGFDANGDLDVAAISTFLAGASGYIVTWYDQSGQGNDCTQATLGLQPLYVASDQNGLPCLSFSGNLLDGSSDTWQSFATVAHMDASPNQHQGLWGRSDSGFSGGVRLKDFGPLYSHDNTDDLAHSSTYRINGAATNSAGTKDTWHVLTCHDTSGNTWPYSVGRSDTYSATRRWKGKVAEIIVSDAQWTSGDETLIEEAANSYWSLY